MDDLEEYLEEAGKLLEVIEKRQARRDKFIDPLVLELEHTAIQYFPEISNMTTDKRDVIRRKAIDRTYDICDFMFKRIYDGVDDMEEDTSKFRVPPRHDEEGNKRYQEERLEKIPPEYHDSYIETFNLMLELKETENELTYDCFEKTKKSTMAIVPGNK